MNIRDLVGYCVIACLAAYGLYHKLDSQNWVKSTAIVERTQFERKSFEDDPYHVTIFYTYQADGIRRSGFSTSQGKTWEQDARRLEKAYPPGKVIAIIYNPKDPERSEVKQPGWYGSFSL